MRTSSFLVLVFVAGSAGGLQAQTQASSPAQVASSGWVVRPLHHELAYAPRSALSSMSSDTARSRPFYLPRPGERTAYWAGLGVGLALSPLLWCEGTGCRTIDKAMISSGLAIVGAVSGLLLSRTF